LRVMVLNIQHAAARRVPLVARAVLAAEPDVVMLSEFYVDDQGRRLLDLLAERGFVHRVHGLPGSERHPYTVAIASRGPINGAVRPLTGAPHAQRILEAEVEGVTMVAVYFPLKEEHEPFWKTQFLPYVETLRDRPTLIAGDWNTGSRFLDIGGGPVAGMARFDALTASGWTDAWRSLHPGAVEFSWYNRRTGNGFRLDHALLSPSLAPRLRSSAYLHEVRTTQVSDHAALVVELTGRPDATGGAR
jgi:exodeoxyribonuclease-3